MKFLFAIAILVTFATLAPTSASAQRRDYLTESEIDLVKEYQQIDLRVGILSKAIDRRLHVLEGASEKRKEAEEWGPLPQGTAPELLRDIEQLISKAISDIDDVAERNARGEFFNKAVHRLADDCKGFIPRLNLLLGSISDGKTRGSISGATSQCEDVIRAAGTLPRETPKDGKKKKP